MNAGIYTRISRDAEGTALGVARQEKDARKLAKARGWDVVAVFNDNDVSAASGRRRPGWEALLQAIEDGEVGAVVAYSSSRMYRRPADLRRLVELSKVRPLDIATVVSGKIDLSTADGRLIAGILAEVDQAEVDRVGERTSRSHAARAERGEVHASLGYGYEGGVPVPEQADAIRDAAQRILSGESMSSVTAMWNAQGLVTTKGNPWKQQVLRRVLMAPRIAGLRSHRGDLYPAVWPPIVDRKTWEALVAHLEHGDRKSLATRGKYLLTGLAVCGKCGATLAGQPVRGKPAYACLKSKGGCNGVRIMAEAMELYVTRLATERDAPKIRAVKDPAKLERRLVKAIEAEEAKLVELGRARFDEGMSPTEYAAIASPIRERLHALEDELAGSSVSAPSSWSAMYADALTVPDSWSEFLSDPGTRASVRADLERKVDHVTVSPVGKGASRAPVAARVQVTWR